MRCDMSRRGEPCGFMSYGPEHLMQIACFDTLLHPFMLRVATLLPLPRRYGYHASLRAWDLCCV
jgi:acetate kinase